MCVTQTAMDLMDRGMEVFVLADGYGGAGGGGLHRGYTP